MSWDRSIALQPGQKERNSTSEKLKKIKNKNMVKYRIEVKGLGTHIQLWAGSMRMWGFTWKSGGVYRD